MKRWILVCLVLVCSVATISAQDIFSLTPTPPPVVDSLNSSVVDAFYTVNIDTPALGERILITLVVDMPLDAEVTDWPELAGDEKLEILKIGGIEEQVSETRRIFRQETEAVLWDLGEYLSEEIVLTYYLNGDQRSVPVRSFFAFVPSQIGEVTEEIHPRSSAPPVDMPYIPQWTYSVAALGLVFAVLLVARLIQTGKQNVVQLVSGSPTQIAIAQLEDMKLQDLPASAVYPLVADYLREYLQLQFGVEATEMTTVELNDTLQQADLLSKNHRRGLRQLLEQADLVKFARFQPDKDTGKRLINYAIKWLREAERFQRAEVTLND